MTGETNFPLWRRVLPHVARAVFALAITVLLSTFAFDYLEYYLYDARMRMTPAPAVSDSIETLVIDDSTIAHFHQFPSARQQATVLEAVIAAKPKYIMYLLPPGELAGSEDDLKHLARILETFPNFYFSTEEAPVSGGVSIPDLHPRFEKVKLGAAPVTFDSAVFARDDVTRRMILAYKGVPSLFAEVAQNLRPDLQLIGSGNQFLAKNVQGAFDYLESDQVYIQYAPSGSYPRTSFQDALRVAGRFRDKVVIIGRDTQRTVKDYVRTPYSRDTVNFTNVELHANMYDTAIRNDAIVRLPKWVDYVVTVIISFLTITTVLTATPTIGLLILGGTLVTYSLLAGILFWVGPWWIGMAHPVLAILICYYFFIPYRLIIENRRSWEYYQKNRLLTQVEELKTNFLSMMSHDLKTPIARIQGMADVVENDPNPLSNRQLDAISTVRRSSQELLEFVSGILNLGRIESKALQLHMHSKDMNALMREVVEKVEYLARSKNIEIRLELETLFSIKVDVDLMRQVFSNLVENAIKYSPEGTSILVTTEEREGWIVIQVSDQGNGIPHDELPHIFMKFYRSRNAKASTIKGSGLGLYLAKYFVELHRGRIQVDSRPGQGSTFTVELPTT